MRRVSNRSECRDCKRTIRWVRMTYGKPRPIDPDPSSLGDVVLIGPVHVEGRDSTLAARVTDQAVRDAVREAGGHLYRFHLETCAAARERLDRRLGSG